MAGLRRPTAGWHGASKARCSKHNSIMKNFRQIPSISLATGTAGVAVFTFANSALVASLPVDAILGITVSLALLSFAAYDYSRRYLPLRLPAPLLRPQLPLPVTSRRLLRDSRKECLAA